MRIPTIKTELAKQNHFYASSIQFVSSITLALLFILFSSIEGFGQATFHSNGNANQDWNNAASWTIFSGSDGDNIPDADDDVVILTGDTRNVNVASACLNLTIETAAILAHTQTVALDIGNDFNMQGTASVTPSATSDARILNVTGNFDVATGANATFGGIQFNVTGNTTIDGDLTFTANPGVKTFTGLVDVQSNGSWNSSSVAADDRLVFQGGITSNGASFTAHRGTFNTNVQIISGSTTVSFAHNVSVDVISVTNNLTSPALFNAGRHLQGDGSFVQGTNAILNIARSANITTLTANANPNTVSYYGTNGGQIACATYHHLRIEKSAVVNATLNCSTTINGDLTVTGGTLRSDLNAGPFTHTVSGSTTFSDATAASTYLIRDNSSILNVQSLSLSGATVRAGASTGTINVATTFAASGNTNTVSDCVLNVSGASTITGPINFDNDNGIKTFQGSVTLSGLGSWTSNVVTTDGNLIFQNGISNSGASFVAGAATFNTNPQSIAGTTTLSFANTVTVTGIELTNNNNVSLTNVANGSLTGTGTWTQGSSSTFNYAGGTLTINTFNVSATDNTVTYNRSDGTAQDVFTPSDGGYYNLTVQGSGSKTPTAHLQIGGDLTIDGTAVLDVSTNSTDLIILGSWINNSTFTAGTQTVFLVGSANAHAIGGSSSTDFYNLRLSNSSGISPEFTLGISTNVENTLTMTNGDVDLGTFSLTLGSAAATPGSLSYTSGNLFNGSFIRYYDAVTIADGNVAGLFPMGDTNGNTRPFYITPATAPSTGGTITVSVTTSDQAVDIGPIDDNGTDIVRQHQASWNVSTGGGLAGGDNYNLRGEGTGFGTIDAVSDLRLMTSGGVVGTDGGAGGSTSNPSVDRTGLSLAQLTNSFHLGSINATDSPLPIKLLSFDAKFELDQVQIHWSTSSETDNDYFTIERSSDGIEYYEIAQIDGAGHSTEKLSYSYTDFSPFSGESYYRLRQTDFDGKTEVFTPVSVQAQLNSSISLYPNPLTGHQFNIQLNKRSEQPTLVSIYDHTGKSVSLQSIEEETSLTVTLSEHLNPGVYLVFVQSGSTTFNQRLLVH